MSKSNKDKMTCIVLATIIPIQPAIKCAYIYLKSIVVEWNKSERGQLCKSRTKLGNLVKEFVGKEKKLRHLVGAE